VKLAGEHAFAVPRERLWQALLDPELLARVLPGCEPLVPEEDGAPAASGGISSQATGGSRFVRYRAAMTLKIGPVEGRFTGTLALSELDPPNGYRMQLDGSGPAGFLRGAGRITLRDAGGGSTLGYELDAQVGGRVASVGQRLVESSARALARQGLEGLERELAARAAQPAVGAAPRPAPAPPSPAAFATRFARGLWRELPAGWRLAAYTLAGALLLALAALARGC
jgi:carbon monoxide dehydrogenase subunit G